MRGLTSAVHIRAEGKYRIWPHDQSQGGSRSGYFGSGRHKTEAGVVVGKGRHSLKATAVAATRKPPRRSQ